MVISLLWRCDCLVVTWLLLGVVFNYGLANVWLLVGYRLVIASLVLVIC